MMRESEKSVSDRAWIVGCQYLRGVRFGGGSRRKEGATDRSSKIERPIRSSARAHRSDRSVEGHHKCVSSISVESGD